MWYLINEFASNRICTCGHHHDWHQGGVCVVAPPCECQGFVDRPSAELPPG
ncbi:hypothetical protein LCGC14_2097420 [marine sediment metagenome]|uniref:Uncharacterized protein n=1 Tax=marine sediment metagenome TaxID=412755 RepID=A0A0F9EY54_9ZZZZ